MLCGDLDGWDEGREVPEGGHVCIHIADHFIVQQKLTKQCKATVLLCSC